MRNISAIARLRFLLISLFALTMVIIVTWAAAAPSHPADGLTGANDQQAFMPVTIGRPPLPVPPGSADQIVYTINSNVYTVHADGSGRTNLTRPGDDASGGRWSPDRKRIAFLLRLPTSAYSIALMYPDGSGVTTIPTPKLDLFGTPEWSPDGQRLTFIAYTKYTKWDVYVMNLDGSNLKNLTADTVTGHSDSPSWSPDGSRIVFRNDNGTQTDLLLMNPDGSNLIHLTNDEFPEYEPDWSPDGQTILFYSSTFNDPALYTMPSTGGAAMFLQDNAQYGRWSPDGTQIVFVGAGGGIFRADADGRNIAPVDETTDAGQPDW